MFRFWCHFYAWACTDISGVHTMHFACLKLVIQRCYHVSALHRLPWTFATTSSSTSYKGGCCLLSEWRWSSTLVYCVYLPEHHLHPQQLAQRLGLLGALQCVDAASGYKHRNFGDCGSASPVFRDDKRSRSRSRHQHAADASPLNLQAMLKAQQEQEHKQHKQQHHLQQQHQQP